MTARCVAYIFNTKALMLLSIFVITQIANINKNRSHLRKEIKNIYWAEETTRGSQFIISEDSPNKFSYLRHIAVKLRNLTWFVLQPYQ